MTGKLDEQLAILCRGAEQIYSIDELRQKLVSGRKLRIKLGMDPTAPDIHLGHSVVLRKLRQFQDLGHKAVLIIGDYTARIGDPTGRDTTRPILGEDQIMANAQTYLEQAGKILDSSSDKLELRYNSEWLASLTFAQVLQLTGQMTVQQMLHRENFKLRMAAGKEIMVSEFMYPLMQAYDSVVIDSDVELGGTDQTFNNLCGRDLMARFSKPRQIVLVMPLLIGLDGSEKMSKSKGNYVGLTDAPNDMFGKVMSIPDALMDNYFRLLTSIEENDILRLTDPALTHPRQAKEELARFIVHSYHGAQAAEEAAEEFRRRFSEGQLPADLQTHSLPSGEHRLPALLVSLGMAESGTEAKRLIAQGAVSLDDAKLTDAGSPVILALGQQVILRVGKRRVCRIEVSA